MYRSLLYVPGNGERFLAKAHERGADAIIIDLEDAVADNAKEAARDDLVRTVPRARQKGAAVFVRINSEPERLLQDAVAACRAGADGLYVPKVESAETLSELDEALVPVEAENGRAAMRLVPLVESPGAIYEARSIAHARRVMALSAGAEDIATAMGARPTPEVVRLPKLLIHLAAKAEGVLSFGLLRSVADYSDSEALKASAIEARDFGFDGASCIHPSVVPVLNDVFAPTAEEIAWAHKVVEAGKAALADGVGAFTVDGKFVDAPIIRRAETVLAKAAPSSE